MIPLVQNEILRLLFGEIHICTYIIHIPLYASKVRLALSVCNISYHVQTK